MSKQPFKSVYLFLFSLNLLKTPGAIKLLVFLEQVEFGLTKGRFYST